MARKPKSKIRAKDLQGLKYFRVLAPLLKPLHQDATQRDKAGNRKLHFDQYTGLVLLYFFNPILTSLRGIQQASELEKVQERLDCLPTSLGSLSEAATVFDPALLHEIVIELGQHIQPELPLRERQALAGLTAVDGSLLPALPRMAWALWVDDTHRAAKMHVAFEVLRRLSRPAVGSSHACGTTRFGRRSRGVRSAQRRKRPGCERTGWCGWAARRRAGT